MIKFTDSVGVGEVKQTKEGYLVATSRVARTGVQNYLASELGDIAINAGFSPNDVVRVNRPESEVFSDAAMNTITRLPITIDHPADDVTSENWSSLSVGDLGDAYKRDGDWIVVNPMIKDAAGIRAAQTTHKEFSAGYQADIVLSKDKAIADFDMTQIKYNHMALVPKGRAGSEARLGDSWGATPIQDSPTGSTPNNPQKGGHHMTTKTVVLGDKAVQVAVEDAAEVERFKSDMAAKLADAETKRQAEIEAKDEEIGTLKVDLKAAKDAAVIDVDALVASRSALVDTAKAIDSDIEVAGKTDSEIRKAAVVAKLGEDSVKDVSDSEITGMFKALSKTVSTNPVADALGTPQKINANDAHSGYAARLTRQTQEN